jgi:hypothetical protein
MILRWVIYNRHVKIINMIKNLANRQTDPKKIKYFSELMKDIK